MLKNHSENIRFEQFTIEDLNQEDTLIKLTSQAILPFSSLRLASFVNNPRALISDVILIVAYHNETLIAYRTLLPDDIQADLTTIHFAWLSGIWVDNAHRHLGIGKKLHQMAHKAWEGRLIGTEYTQQNAEVMLSTGFYTQNVKKSGIIIYYKSPLEAVLIKRMPNLNRIRSILKLTDKLIDSFGAIKNTITKPLPFDEQYQFKLSGGLNAEAINHIQEFGAYSTTNRRSKELEWIVKYPWIASDAEALMQSKKYYFSVFAKSFSTQFLEIFFQGTLQGIVMLTVRDGALRIPYIFVKFKELDTTAKYIQQFAEKEKISKIISYHSLLNKELIKWGKRRLFYKNTTRSYMVSKSLIGLTKLETLVFTDGDGDCVFV